MQLGGGQIIFDNSKVTSNLDSTLSKLLASNTSSVGRLAWLVALLGIGKALIQRIGKLTKQREGKLDTYWPARASVVRCTCRHIR